jgi:predicted ATPase
MLGAAYTQLGRFDDAHRALDEAMAVAEKNDNRGHEAELHRLRGELVLAESPGQAAGAETHFRRAIEVAQAQLSKGWELRATTSLARLKERTGRKEDARTALAAVYGTYAEGFEVPDLVDAERLLAQVS